MMTLIGLALFFTLVGLGLGVLVALMWRARRID